MSLHQLPPPPRDFTGRTTELAELFTASSQRGVTIFGLHGLGGIGKTTLALKLAEQLVPSYPDAQFYLDLKGTSQQPLSSAEAMAHIIHAYHPTAILPENEAELHGLYESVLYNQCALLLMDNAANAEQVAPLIPNSSCALLVTSRQHVTLPGLFTMRLDILRPEEACEWLLTIAPRIDKHTKEFAQLCGYLPLALRVASSTLTERVDLRVEDYMRRLVNIKQRLRLTGVEASLNLSFELLSAELQQLWCALSVFPSTFDASAATAVWEIETDLAQDALSTLVRYNLVEWDAETSRYRLHDLVRSFVTTRSDDIKREIAQKRHAVHFLTVMRQAHTSYRAGGERSMRGLALFDIEWESIQSGREWAKARASQDELAAKLCVDYHFGGIDILDIRQSMQERIEWITVALDANRRLKRDLGNRVNEGHLLGNLGLAYADRGDHPRAIEFYKQSLNIARECGDLVSEGNALGNLGGSYNFLHEYALAIQFYQQSLAIKYDSGQGLYFDSAKILLGLGSAYDGLGEMHRAIEYTNRALLAFRKIGNRRGEGNALGNLGVTYVTLGDHPRAIEFYEQSLAIVREVGDRRAECNALHNLGSSYSYLREFNRAIEFYMQALELAREVGDCQAECKALSRLAAIYYENQQDYDRAAQCWEQYLSAVRVLGDLESEGMGLFNLSLILDALGNRARAIAHSEAALDILEKTHSPSAANVSEQLARWEFQAFSSIAAEWQLEVSELFSTPNTMTMMDPLRTMHRCFQALPPEQRDVLRALKLLAIGGVFPFTHERLLAVLEHLFDRRDLHLGDLLEALTRDGFLRHPPQQNPVRPEPAYLINVVTYTEGKHPIDTITDLTESLTKLSDASGLFSLGLTCLMKKQTLQHALVCFDRCLFFDPRNSAAWSNKGEILRRIGNHHEALSCFQEALQLDPEYPEVWNNKGLVLMHFKQYDESLTSLEKAIQFRSDYAEAWNNKGILLDRMGRHQEALDCNTKSLQIIHDRPEFWSNKGLVLIHLGKYEEALSALDTAIRLQSDLPEAWFNKGTVLGSMESWEESIQAFDETLRLRPEYGEAWLGKGIVLRRIQQFEEAVKTLNCALQLLPESVEAWNVKGDALDELGHYDEAILAYEQALCLESDSANIWNNKGVTFVKSGRYEEAFKAFAQALQLNPNYAAPWQNRAEALLSLGRFLEALEASNNALRLKAEYPEALVDKGLALCHLGSFEEAVIAFDEALRLRPEYYQAWCNKGMALEYLDRYQESLDAYGKAVQLNFDSPEVWFNKGTLLGKLGRYLEALSDLDQALRLKPEFPEAWHSKALVLIYLGRNEHAVEWLCKLCMSQGVLPSRKAEAEKVLRTLGYSTTVCEKFLPKTHDVHDSTV